MTPDELRAARKRLGLSQEKLARELQRLAGEPPEEPVVLTPEQWVKMAEAFNITTDRTIRRMEAGDVPIGGPVEMAVTLLLEHAGQKETER